MPHADGFTGSRHGPVHVFGCDPDVLDFDGYEDSLDKMEDYLRSLVDPSEMARR
jgi:hypothetical protein